MQLTRKQFLTVGAIAGATVTLIVTGCGSDDSDSGGGGGGSCSPDIVGNHGHTLVISAADLEAGANKTYNIQGTSPHDHEVILTAAHFTSLKNGSSVSVTSTSTAGHDHPITITCA